MIKNIFLLAIVFMSLQAVAQNFVREKDKKTGKVCLRGQINFNDVMDESNYKWFTNGYKKYEPNESAIEGLHKYWSPYKFIVFGGTWCEDTQDLLPKFYKTLLNANIDLNSVEMYAVNRNKEALNSEHLLYNIRFVPTIIVMHQYREVGRIVENVNTSIEADLLKIIEKDYMELEKKRLARFN